MSTTESYNKNPSHGSVQHYNHLKQWETLELTDCNVVGFMSAITYFLMTVLPLVIMFMILIHEANEGIVTPAMLSKAAGGIGVFAVITLGLFATIDAHHIKPHFCQKK